VIVDDSVETVAGQLTYLRDDPMEDAGVRGAAAARLER